MIHVLFRAVSPPAPFTCPDGVGDTEYSPYVPPAPRAMPSPQAEPRPAPRSSHGSCPAISLNRTPFPTTILHSTASHPRRTQASAPSRSRLKPRRTRAPTLSLHVAAASTSVRLHRLHLDHATPSHPIPSIGVPEACLRRERCEIDARSMRGSNSSPGQSLIARSRFRQSVRSRVSSDPVRSR